MGLRVSTAPLESRRDIPHEYKQQALALDAIYSQPVNLNTQNIGSSQTMPLNTLIAPSPPRGMHTLTSGGRKLLAHSPGMWTANLSTDSSDKKSTTHNKSPSRPHREATAEEKAINSILGGTLINPPQPYQKSAQYITKAGSLPSTPISPQLAKKMGLTETVRKEEESKVIYSQLDAENNSPLSWKKSRLSAIPEPITQSRLFE